MLYLLVLGICFEALLYFKYTWNIIVLRLTFSMLATACTIFAFVAAFIYVPSWGTVGLALIGLYRIANQYRIFKNRMHDRYLLNATRGTSLRLIGLQALLFALWVLYYKEYLSAENGLYIFAFVQCAISVVLLASTVRRIARTKVAATTMSLSSNDLPSVTIAIPARNETTDLQDCLQAVINTDYPKLEILVLDDCSQLRRTPEIIREFAHAGVRFVKGEEPAKNWLAKNQAYDKLLREANGEIVVFCGVDVRLQPDSIRQIVEVMHQREKKMISVLPRRSERKGVQYSLVQAARYMWELAPPRKLIQRPPVVSTCWAIYRKDALRLGGLRAVSRAILPELFFAKQLIKEDGYSFLRANDQLAIYSAKSHAAQRATAVRVRYPQLRKRPETVLLFTAFMFAIFVMPYIALAWAIVYYQSVLFIALLLVGIASSIVSYILVAYSTGVMSWWLVPVMVVPTVLADIVLMNYSFLKYEFSNVVWKGRNICLPVMHVTSSLPKV